MTQPVDETCAACDEPVPFRGMRCRTCFVGTTEEYLFDHVPAFALGGEGDQPDLPNTRVGVVSGAHISVGILDLKGGQGEPEWLDQMYHAQQAATLVTHLTDALAQLDDDATEGDD